MTLLHEILAVEKSLKSTAEKFLTDATKVFKSKGLFTGFKRRYTPLMEGDLELPPEDKEMVTTVRDKLQYALDAEGKYLDCMATKEVTNTVATGVISLPELSLPKLPATLLLSLESRLKMIRDVIESTPNIDAALLWNWDENEMRWRTNPVKTFKTKKVMKNHVKAVATDKHPAQVETYSEDIPIGTWEQTIFSGELTSRQKADILGRVDALIHEVKCARQRANTTEVTETKIGEAIMNYIMKPLY